MAHQSSPKYSEAESSGSRSRTSQTASGALAYFAANAKPVSEYISPYAQPTNKGAHLQPGAISQPQGASSSTAYTALNSNLRVASLEEENNRVASGSAYSTSSQNSSIYSSASGNMSSVQKISPVSGVACFPVLWFCFSILSFFCLHDRQIRRPSEILLCCILLLYFLSYLIHINAHLLTWIMDRTKNPNSSVLCKRIKLTLLLSFAASRRFSSL